MLYPCPIGSEPADDHSRLTTIPTSVLALLNQDQTHRKLALKFLKLRTSQLSVGLRCSKSPRIE